MFPILFTIGNFPVSSFGLFLVLGIFFGAFSVWRIARSFDFEAEKVLDIIFLTIGTAFISSRLIFVVMNLPVFDTFSKIFFVNRYPGLSFWGGLLGGILALHFLAKRNKIAFFQVTDIAMVGFFIAAFWTEVGCLLGACGIGQETTSLFSVDQVGVIGKRLPVQIVEAVIFLLVFFVLWKRVLRFHVEGSILAFGLVVIGLVKFVATLFKSPVQNLLIGSFSIKLDLIFAAFVFLLGLYFHYKSSKKTPASDLASFFRFFISPKMQRSLLTKIIRWCYNQKANFTVGLSKGRKKLFKSLNVKSNPERF